jgi:hypothetical protein
VVTRLLLLFLCLGVLSTVTGCYVEPTAYGTSSSRGGRQDEMYHPWNRPPVYDSNGGA